MAVNHLPQKRSAERSHIEVRCSHYLPICCYRDCVPPSPSGHILLLQEERRRHSRNRSGAKPFKGLATRNLGLLPCVGVCMCPLRGNCLAGGYPSQCRGKCPRRLGYFPLKDNQQGGNITKRKTLRFLVYRRPV